ARRLQHLPAQRRGRRAPRPSRAVRRRPAAGAERLPPRGARGGSAGTPQQRAAAPRAHHPDAHRGCRRGASRQDRAGMDSLPETAAGPAGRHPLREQRAGEARTRAQRRADAHGVFRETRAGRQASTFSVTYELTLSAQYHVIDPAQVVPATITPALAPYVAERPPHLVFTEQLRLFS